MINIDIDHFRARILQDALTEATAAYWQRRAQAFEDAAPRLGEYHGQASQEQLRDAWISCMATAEACRRFADLISGEYPEPITEEVWDVLGEVA
jgi:hypothetical protein